jgi:predicted enzyme related to lactoylglutathione lyase
VGYIAVDDLDATLAQVIERGGRALMPRMDIAEAALPWSWTRGVRAFI